jgi:hypothetical protein
MLGKINKGYKRRKKMIKKKACKAKKGNWSIKKVYIGKNKKLDKLECLGLPKGSSCKGKGGVVLPPHPLKKTPPRNYVGMDSWGWIPQENPRWKTKKGNWGKEAGPSKYYPKKKIDIWGKPAKKRKWYEKPIRINKGRK